LVVAVIGAGLVGGSVGLAARRRLGAHVRGVDPDAAAALAAGAIDEACDDLAAAVDGADVAFVATPLALVGATVDAVLAVAAPDCVVTDVGSTKRAIVAGRTDPRFVGGHPLAGSEASGAAHAREELFDGATWYLTPTAATSGVLFERLHRTLTALGARPAAIDAEAHDRLMATVSHLPHVLANLLVEQATAALDDETVPATGPSFRDATRVAGANPALWPDILLANRDALLAQVDATVGRLAEVRAAVEAGDRDALERWQRDAGDRRRALLQAALAAGPTRELRVAVPNRPGVVAEVALGLGRAGINISDMSLSPSPDFSRGEIALWVGEGDLERARAIVGGVGTPL
jgi:prephenate dehydrogenase